MLQVESLGDSPECKLWIYASAVKKREYGCKRLSTRKTRQSTHRTWKGPSTRSTKFHRIPRQGS